MEKRVGNVRWGIAALLGVGIVINYFDRVNLSVATTPLIKENLGTDAWFYCL
jgi:MFS transporter, ACS family, D-galactonate transporter